MKAELAVRALAGTFIVVSLLLSEFHSHNWIYFTGFVGLNLFQSAFTKFCPAEIILKKIGFK